MGDVLFIAIIADTEIFIRYGHSGQHLCAADVEGARGRAGNKRAAILVDGTGRARQAGQSQHPLKRRSRQFAAIPYGPRSIFAGLVIFGGVDAHEAQFLRANRETVTIGNVDLLPAWFDDSRWIGPFA